MATGIACETCPNFVADATAANKSGNCRANPPLPVLAPQVDTLGRQAIVIRGLWPPVGVADWCAKHPMFGISDAMPIDGRLSRDHQGEA